MTLPQQVQAQLDHAESILTQINAPAAAAEPPVPPPAEAVTGSETPAPAETAAPASQPAAPKAPAPDSWEHKYKTLQGIHNSHVRDLKSRSEALEQQVADLTAELNAKPAEKPEVSLDPKDAEVFGADMVDMVQRVAEAMFGQAAKSFDARIAAIEQRLEGTSREVSRTAEEVFYDRLGTAVPDYETLNEDPGFLAWLGEVDPVYGAPRQAALTAAAGAMDVARVARIFLTYKNLQNPASASQTPSASQQLERQVAPPTVNAPQPRQQGGKPLITEAEVQSFYNDMRQGKYRGREDEAVRAEAIINAAMAEGRIVARRPQYTPV